MAEAAISTLLQLLGDQLIQKVKSLRGVEGKVELLKVELKAMQSFLKDANKKQYEDERVRNWISQIRELAQDAEDTIEMFLLNVENARSMSFLNKCTNFGKRMHHLDTIGEEIESILKKIAAIKSSRETYGIKDLDEAVESASRLQVEARRRLFPGQKDEHVTGIEDDVKKVLQESILDEEKKGLCIAFLEGIGGIGKSTLAREIYNHTNIISGRFECRAWVVVSSEFAPQETIKQLIFQLQRSEEEKKEVVEKIKILEESTRDKLYVQEQLNQLLHNQLEGKSYLIVLDDVWETQHLESLVTAFPNQQDNSGRLLVTTRNKITTKYDQYVHKMKVLDPEKSWDLMLKKAFINGKCLQELESVGRQILEKCHGLPLAISVVGGLLMETQTKSGWEQILKDINFYLGRSESNVSSILELSYQNLSPQLKSCFLCSSFFKEDFTIPAKRLVNIWDTQGLIQQEGSITTDEVGRGYLNELINRSMLQIEDLTLDGRVKNCRIHDLVREVCLRKAKEEIGLEMVKQGEEGTSTKSSLKPRHRVVYGKNLQTSSSNQNKHLRSLFLLNDQDDWDFYVTTPSGYWKSYQLLKTLELDGCEFKRLPNSFRLLIGLKCLRVGYSEGTIVNFLIGYKLDLPSWLDHLKNLEVLDMEGCEVRFPRLLPLKMERLRYFHAYYIARGPRQISSWKNMECLKHINHDDWMRFCTSNLTSGCRLRELGIHIKFNAKREELMKVKASLEKLQNLVILHLGPRTMRSRRTEMALAIPNHLASLTKLKLANKKLKCPAATLFPPNLSHLTLMFTCLDDDQMAELGKLPKLSFLKLKDLYYMGTMHVLCDGFPCLTMHVLCDGFPCLEALSLQSLWNLEGIVIEEGGMPKLKHLRIRHCLVLETWNLPEHINIEIVK